MASGGRLPVGRKALQSLRSPGTPDGSLRRRAPLAFLHKPCRVAVCFAAGCGSAHTSNPEGSLNMQTLLTANSQLSSLFSLSPADLDKVVGTGIAGRKGICDVFLQAGTDQGLVFDQGTLKRTSCSVVNGAGVRVVIGDKTGYSYTDQVDLPSLLLAAQTARAIAE